MMISLRYALPLLAAVVATSRADGGIGSDYGMDCSFPIHYNHEKSWTCGDQLGDRKTVYENFMQGCRDHFGPKRASSCDITEEDRLKMSRLQPRSMVNYTSTGFKKIRAPQQVMDLLNKHWEANKQARQKERWSTGNVYVNWWESPTYMVSVEDSNLRGGGSLLKQKVWDSVQPVVEEWTGMELKPASQYGIRIYTEGAILSPHVDRIPLISSCIINVAQDVDEPWPLEVIDREGRAVNVTMEPGDMVLYESHSLIHARPFPLKGRYMANIFIHFEPTGRPLSDHTTAWMENLPDFLPPYIVEGSAWAQKWARENPNGWHRPAPSGPKLQTDTSRESHVAAALNDLDTLQHLAVHKPQLLHKADENGWHPLHESARSGHKDAAELLIKNGADMNARTGRYKDGQSVLNLALEHHPEESDIVQYLRSIGAQDIAMEEL